MADQPTCREQVGEPPGYWHRHTCGRKAKWVVDGRNGERIAVCGTHVKWYQRHDRNVEPITLSAGGDRRKTTDGPA